MAQTFKNYFISFVNAQKTEDFFVPLVLNPYFCFEAENLAEGRALARKYAGGAYAETHLQTISQVFISKSCPANVKFINIVTS